MRAWTISRTGCAFLAFLCLPLYSAASAKDLKMLARLLAPAYLAQDFATLCAADDAQFRSPILSYGVPSISAFAQHRKREVTVDLPEDEALSIRIAAADAARALARQKLYLLSQQTDDPTGSVKQWCDHSAKPFIMKVLSEHQEDHKEFDILVEKAKH